jgi:hypothetical protein
MLVFKKIPDELDSFDGDLVAAIIGEDERPLQSTNAWLDWRLFGSISELINRGIFTGKLGEKCLMPTYGKFNFDRLILVGGGELFDGISFPSTEEGLSRWNTIADIVNETISSLNVEKIGLSLPRFVAADQEKALLKCLQSSHLPVSTNLFMSRASKFSLPLSS